MKEAAVEAVREPRAQDGPEGGPHPKEVEVRILSWVKDSPSGGVMLWTDAHRTYSLYSPIM